MAGVQWSNLGVGGRIGESPILLFSCQPARDGERLYLKVGIGHDLRYGWSVGVKTHWSNVEIGENYHISDSPFLPSASQG